MQCGAAADLGVVVHNVVAGLDLDIDEFLDSPKLRLKLSPAELDKSLLELYDAVVESPGGDILRLIGGGGFIAMQNLYMRRQAERKRLRKMKKGAPLDTFIVHDDEDQADDKDGTITQLIRRSLRKNIPDIVNKNGRHVNPTVKTNEKSENTPSMCFRPEYSLPSRLHTWSGLRKPAVLSPRRSSNHFSVLI